MGVTIDCVWDGRAKLGEAAFWDDRRNVLWWVDIAGKAVHRFDPDSGRDTLWDVPWEPGCIVPCARDSRLIVAGRRGFWFFDPADGGLTPIVDPEADLENQRYNDGTTDPRGRFWCGTMSMSPERPATGAFWRLDADFSAHRLIDGIRTTNGLAFAPDGRTMYFSDSAPSVRMIWACDYDVDTGTPSNRRVFHDATAMQGRPDGGTIDSEGCYWTAAAEGWQIIRLTPAGKVDRAIPVPVEKPTKLAFGGAGYATMYLTSFGAALTPGTEQRQPHAGGIHAICVPGVQGIAPWRFDG